MHFLFDAQMPIRLAKGLAIIDQENAYGKRAEINISHVIEILGDGATDEQVIIKAK